ncbi:Pesticin receptor [Paraglaciecola mesophila]|uniref:Pesticin receptor n=1 Tax=Paraglaciecola mesophila TaxID=197222 RepID=A0A857JMA6_9ALTE|nr:TonB-dependent receptor [Paraglaciecola mesophila]QHJ13209.1 Pesticin receptor [Paraglaciecola mesophila]
MHNKLKSFTQSTLALCVSLSLIPDVHAQNTGSPTASEQAQQNDLEIISISARGRTESIQSVPDSVTAFSSEMIENARISNFQDLADLTPNLSQLDNFRPGLSRITIRGLITPQVGDPPIAFVVDGVTASDIEFINQDLVDVERIEVMRGAQGALYGRGAVGGAVLITTKQPIEDFEGSIKGTYSNGNAYHLSGVLSGSLNEEDTAYFRMGGYTKSSDGLIDNRFLNDEADALDEDSIFGQLQFDLFDDTSLNIKGRYTTSTAGFAYYQGVTEDTIEDFSIQTSQNIANRDERDVYELSARLSQDYALGTFEFITAYSKSENAHFYDGDYSADATFIDEEDFFRAPFGTQGIFDVESVTVESRFTSQSDQPLRWAASLFYQDRQRDSAVSFFDDFVGDSPRTRSDFTDDDIYLVIADENSSKAWAVSGQINYDITDKLELTGALRFDQDKRESFDPNFAADTFAAKTFSQSQPKVTLAYQATSDVLIYSSYSKGFRSGGFNEPAEGISRTFDKEVSDSYEAGFKSTLFDNTVTLNGAAFRIEQEDAQVTVFNVDTYTLENLAIDSVDTQGLELELGFAANENLDIRLSAGWVDSEIKRFNEQAYLEGETMVWVPEYNATLSATHQAELNDTWTLTSRAALQIDGPKSFDISQPQIRSSEYRFIDASIGLRSEQWTVQLFVNNLTDERAIQDIFLYDDGVTEFARQPNKPRSYGVEASYRF